MAKVKKNLIRTTKNKPPEADVGFDANRISNRAGETFGEISTDEKPADVGGATENIEKKKFLEQEIIAEKELREKIENIDLPDNLKQQTQEQAEAIEPLKEGEKIEKLLEIARKKGIVFAVKVAQKMDNPYVLDKLHDILIEKGYYEKFLK